MKAFLERREIDRFVTPMVALALSILCVCASTPVRANESRGLQSVSLQLKWTHQFQFAGYYMAIEKGYYREAGLDVHLKPGSVGIKPVREVLEGRADFGVGTTELLLDRSAGEPVLVLAVIYQHSPLALAVRKSSGIDNIHQLKGKRLMIEPGSAELYALLSSEGIDKSSLKIVEHSIDPQEFIRGKVDAMSVYETDEPFAFERAGVGYSIFSARAAGIDFYGDNLFTSEQQLERHPERTSAFLEASMRGWKYAMENIDETVDVILRKYPTEKTREHLIFEARESQRLIRSDLVEMGYMYRGRWQHIAETYRNQKMIRDLPDLDSFLHLPKEQEPIPTWVWVSLVGAATLVLTVLLFSVNVFRSRRRLRLAFDEIRILRGIFPICMHCKNIRTDDGLWNQIDHYLASHTDAQFSHGICPTCYAKLYPDDDEF